MPSTDDSNEKNRFFSFRGAARILGFIADVLAISLIVLSTLGLMNASVSSVIISPGFALAIWVLSVYVYLAMLNEYWAKNRQERRYSRSFSRFLFMDLLMQFRQPWLALPLVVAYLLLFGIAYAWNPSGQFINYLLWIAGGFVFIMFFRWFVSIPTPPSDSTKTKISKNWGQIESSISAKLNRKEWVAIGDIDDAVTSLNLGRNGAIFVLSKFAMDHPEETQLAHIYSIERDERLTGSYKALVNVRKIDGTKYRYQ